LPQKAQDVKDALGKKGFRQSTKKGRDHDFFFFFHNNRKTNIFTKISHGEREIHDQNCSNMARQMRLTNPQFQDFVDCPLELSHYLQILIQANHIQQGKSPAAPAPAVMARKPRH
jgi:hypothetical protein